MKPVAISAYLLLAGLLPALPCAAANLLQNPGFDADISGWTPTVNGGTVSWDGAIGDPAGSILTSSPAPNTSATAAQCVAISAPANVDFIVDGFADQSVLSGGYIISATSFDAAGCTGTNLGDLPAGGTSFPPGGWGGFEIAASNQPLPNGTQSVLVTVGSSAGAAAGSVDNYHFDNIQFGPSATTPVDLQSFEVD